MARVQVEDIELPERDEADWDVSNNAALETLARRTKGSYMIVLELFGIVEGDKRTAVGTGYSQAEWDVAYNNKIGIQAALDYAASNGYQKVMLPNGHYTICYSNKTSDVISNIVHNDHDIVIPSNITMSMMNDVTISVMFDSDTTATSGDVIRNPHDLGSYIPNDLPGNVFSFSKSYNSHIIGGTIIGEMAQRSFVGPNEAWREFNTGVYIRRGSTTCSCKYTTAVGFSGDSFSGVSSHNPDFGLQLPDSEVRTFYKGELSRVDGTVDTGVATSYATALVSLDNIDREKCDELTLRTNLGTQRFPEFKNTELNMCWYDVNDTFIASENFSFLQVLKIPYNAAKIRMGCFGEDAGPASIFITLRITPPCPSDYEVSNCIITENNRGGISNMVNSTVIRNNRIYNIGLGWKEGDPQFPDGTRYGINCEDGLAYNITIYDNVINNTNHGILMSGLDINIKNNKISNCTGNGLVLYYMQDAIASENIFMNCGLALGFIESTLGRNIIIADNITHNCNFIDVSQSAYVNTSDTVIKFSGNIENSPYVMLKSHTDHMHNFIITDHTFNQTPVLNGVGKLEYFRGFAEGNWNIKEDQIGTNYIYTNTLKGSDVTINCTDKDRRLGNEGSVYGLSQNGGKQYRALVASSDRTYNFYGEGHAVLNPDQFEFPQTGTPASTVHTLNFYDFKAIKMNGGFSQLFNFDTNTSNGTTTLNINLYNCPIKIDEGIGGTLFYIDYPGANHHVNILLDNSDIDVTATSETVYLGSRHASSANNVQLTLKNTAIKGGLDDTATGFDIIKVIDHDDTNIVSGNNNIGISSSDPKSKLDVNGGIKIADDTDTATVDKVGTIRYRATGTDSYTEMCMQTGASTYAWEIIKQITF